MANVFMKSLTLPNNEDVFYPLPIINTITDEDKILQIKNGEWIANFPDYIVSENKLESIPLPDELYQRIINIKGLLKGSGEGKLTQALADVDYISPAGGKMSGALVAQTSNDTEIRQMRNIVFSTKEPTSSDGEDGDIWIVYTV